MDVKGAVVVISGAGSGLGAATAMYLHGLGAQLALIDRDANPVKAIAANVSGLAIACDVTDENALQAAFDTIKNHFATGVRVCVNCAGICPSKRIVGRDGAMPLADFTKVINVNLIGTFNMMRLAAEQMLAQTPLADSQERGVIINTASVAAFEGQIGQAAYSASKGGVVGLTLPAARELAKFAVRVLTIAPGLMQTPMMEGLSEEVQASLTESTVFPPRLGKPEEFAKCVAHIIENPLLNGCTVRLDGAVRLAAS